MPSDSGDRRATAAKPPHQLGGGGGGGVGAPPPDQEHLPCPRCDSTNTKFCYYNNYNFSQPRHFCKACRRYWTHGGTLRDIPVGGGSRKNAKRSRVTSSHNNSAVPSALEYRQMGPANATPILIPFASEQGGAVQFLGDGKPGVGMCGSFTSLLNSTQGPGIFGIGVGGFEDVSFGLGRAMWPFSNIVDGGVSGSATAVGGGGMIGGGNTWQLEGGDGGGFMGGGDCFVLPDLAISTPGNALK